MLNDFLARDLAAYKTEAERAAYRAGLSSAAAICDALKTEVLAGNAKSRGDGPTKIGASLAMIAAIAGDRISEFRDKITLK